MQDEKGIDDKIIAVCADDPRMEEIISLTTVPKHLRKEIEEFSIDIESFWKSIES